MKFEVKISYQKIDQNGKVANAAELYLLEAVSFSDAEQRINTEMEPFITGEFKILAIKAVNYAEVVPDIFDLWFKGVVCYTTIDEEKGMERKAKAAFLINAESSQQALNKIEEMMKGSVTDYTVPMVVETKILDYFPLES